MSTENLENPILNSPYEVPARHFELSSNGPTGVILDGRRASQSFVPVPVQTKSFSRPDGPLPASRPGGVSANLHLWSTRSGRCSGLLETLIRAENR